MWIPTLSPQITLKKFQILDPKKSYVLMDFDRTITAQNSSTTWGLLEESKFVDSGYTTSSLELYKKYNTIDENPNLLKIYPSIWCKIFRKQ